MALKINPYQLVLSLPRLDAVPGFRHVLQRSGQCVSYFLMSTLLAGAQPLAVLAAEPPLSGTQLTEDRTDQQLRPLSLKEAQQLAQEHHPALQAAALAVAAREAQLEGSLSAWKPQVNLGSSSGLPALALEYQYTPDNSYPRGELETGVNLETTWLWRDPQREARIAAEGHELEQVRMEYQILQRDVNLQVAESYHELQRADTEVELRLAAVDTAQATLDISRARYEAGVASRLDVLQVQAQLTGDETLLATAKAHQVIARRRLARVLNLPQGVVPTAQDAHIPRGHWRATLEKSLAAAFASREELQQFLAAKEAGEARAKEALAALQPTLSLFAMVSWSQASGNALSNASALESQFRGRVSTAMGMRFTLQLNDGGAAQAGARRWRFEARRQGHLLADARNSFHQRVETAFYTLQAQEDMLELRARQVITQQEILNLTTARYKAGVDTQQDMIDQQNALSRASIDHAQALLDYNLSLAQLQRYTGLPIQP